MVQLNLELVNPEQHRDSLKVARVQKGHPCKDVARMSEGCRKGVERVSQEYRKDVARMSQGCCKDVARMSPGCR